MDDEEVRDKTPVNTSSTSADTAEPNSDDAESAAPRLAKKKRKSPLPVQVEVPEQVDGPVQDVIADDEQSDESATTDSTESPIDSKLTKAAVETLAIIAYKQPILRAEVEAIRGVACGETIRSLMEKHLVRIAGRAEEPGRPILYGTTKRFLELFGLNTLKDLPQGEELQLPKAS